MKISIITATYNSGKTIRDTMESILRQTYQDYEYIIKDGASTDNTLDIVKEYEPRFEGKMKIISAPDDGIYDAMNKGIEATTGDVVGLLNSDDFYTSDDILENVHDEMTKNPDLDAVYGDIHFVNDKNLKKCVRYYSSRFFRPWMLRCGFIPAHPSFYCKTEVYRKYGLYDLKYKTSADNEMMVRLFAKHKIKAKYINKDFVTMRMGGLTTAGVNSWYRINKDISTILKNHGIYSNQFLQSFRYAWRIIELLYTKVKF